MHFYNCSWLHCGTYFKVLTRDRACGKMADHHSFKVMFTASLQNPQNPFPVGDQPLDCSYHLRKNFCRFIIQDNFYYGRSSCCFRSCYSELGLTIYQRKKGQRALYTQYEQVARVLCSRIPMFPERISLLTHIFSTQFILQQVTYITCCSNPGVRRRISISKAWDFLFANQ